jgi:hypothetical protein
MKFNFLFLCGIFPFIIIFAGQVPIFVPMFMWVNNKMAVCLQAVNWPGIHIDSTRRGG